MNIMVKQQRAPATAGLHLGVARIHISGGDLDAAEAQYRKALALAPDQADACRELGCLLYESGRAGEATALLDRALAQSSDDAAARQALAHALFAEARTDEAIAVVEAGLALTPDKAGWHLLLATLHELANDLPAAGYSAARVLELAPGNASATILLAKLALRAGDAEAALVRLDTLAAEALAPAQQVTLQAERGRALERLGRHGETFAAWQQSGAMLAQLQAGAPAQDLAARAERLRAVEDDIDAGAWRRFALADPLPAGPQPIFVTGFMRSGTTLIERMLGAHPQIAPRGELTLIADIADALAACLPGGFPAGLDTIGAADAHDLLASARQAYLDGASAQAGDTDAPFFVDKAPFNAEHVGLIRLLFPAAPLIHAQRHPLDIVLSSHFTNFADPQPWSYTLEDAAALFARVHAHLQAMAPRLPAPLAPVRYETLVADPEPVMRALLDAIGVGWDARCLAFHEQAREVHTASYAQVAQPLHDRAVGRYRHYLPFIDAAVLDTLRPALADLGYALDG